MKGAYLLVKMHTSTYLVKLSTFTSIASLSHTLCKMTGSSGSRSVQFPMATLKIKIHMRLMARKTLVFLAHYLQDTTAVEAGLHVTNAELMGKGARDWWKRRTAGCGLVSRRQIIFTILSLQTVQHLIFKDSLDILVEVKISSLG